MHATLYPLLNLLGGQLSQNWTLQTINLAAKQNCTLLTESTRVSQRKIPLLAVRPKKIAEEESDNVVQCIAPKELGKIFVPPFGFIFQFN